MLAALSSLEKQGRQISSLRWHNVRSTLLAAACFYRKHVTVLKQIALHWHSFRQCSKSDGYSSAVVVVECRRQLPWTHATSRHRQTHFVVFAVLIEPCSEQKLHAVHLGHSCMNSSRVWRQNRLCWNVFHSHQGAEYRRCMNILYRRETLYMQL